MRINLLQVLNHASEYIMSDGTSYRRYVDLVAEHVRVCPGASYEEIMKFASATYLQRKLKALEYRATFSGDERFARMMVDPIFYTDGKNKLLSQTYLREKEKAERRLSIVTAILDTENDADVRSNLALANPTFAFEFGQFIDWMNKAKYSSGTFDAIIEIVAERLPSWRAPGEDLTVKKAREYVKDIFKFLFNYPSELPAGVTKKEYQYYLNNELSDSLICLAVRLVEAKAQKNSDNRTMEQMKQLRVGIKTHWQEAIREQEEYLAHFAENRQLMDEFIEETGISKEKIYRLWEESYKPDFNVLKQIETTANHRQFAFVCNAWYLEIQKLLDTKSWVFRMFAEEFLVIHPDLWELLEEETMD